MGEVLRLFVPISGENREMAFRKFAPFSTAGMHNGKPRRSKTGSSSAGQAFFEENLGAKELHPLLDGVSRNGKPAAVKFCFSLPIFEGKRKLAFEKRHTPFSTVGTQNGKLRCQMVETLRLLS